TSYGRNRVGEGYMLLTLPVHASLFLIRRGQQPVHQSYDTVHPQQTRLSTQYRSRTPTPRALQAQVSAGLFTRGFYIPAAGVFFNDLLGRLGHIRAIEVLITVRAGQVMHVHPTYFDQTLPRSVPVPGTSDHFDITPTTTVPGHIQSGACGTGHHFLGLRQLGSLDTGSAVAGIR